MDFTNYLKGFSRINTARLALWVALMVMALVAGMAALGSCPS
jgi:hypothetical protein